MLLMRLTSLSLKQSFGDWPCSLEFIWHSGDRDLVCPFDQRYKTETDSILGKFFSNAHLDFMSLFFASAELLADLLAIL